MYQIGILCFGAGLIIGGLIGLRFTARRKITEWENVRKKAYEDFLERREKRKQDFNAKA